jgi:hypothetical protein
MFIFILVKQTLYSQTLCARPLDKEAFSNNSQKKK